VALEDSGKRQTLTRLFQEYHFWREQAVAGRNSIRLQRTNAVNVAETIRAKLTEAFSPNSLEVIDESHLHAGHVGARPEGETHFRVEMTAAMLAGDSRVDRQRKVYAVLADELAGPVHALALKISAP